MVKYPQSYRPVYPCPHSPAELLAARAPPCLHWCHGASYCPSHCCAVCGGWTGTSLTVFASPSGSPVQETWWIEKLLTKVYYVGICEIRQQIQIHVNINLKKMKHLYLNFKINNQDLIKKKKDTKHTSQQVINQLIKIKIFKLSVIMNEFFILRLSIQK